MVTVLPERAYPPPGCNNLTWKGISSPGSDNTTWMARSTLMVPCSLLVKKPLFKKKKLYSFWFWCKKGGLILQTHFLKRGHTYFTSSTYVSTQYWLRRATNGVSQQSSSMMKQSRDQVSYLGQPIVWQVHKSVWSKTAMWMSISSPITDSSHQTRMTWRCVF